MRYAALTLFIAWAVFAPTGQACAQRTAESTGKWRADLEVFRTELPLRHRDAFHQLSREAFNRAVDSLQANAPTLSDDQLALGIARVVASLGDRDGHSHLNLLQRRLGFRVLPIQLHTYADGIAVRAASAANAAIVGARLVAIAGMPIEEVVRRVEPLAPGDNSQSRLGIRDVLLSVPRVLRGVGVPITDPDDVVLSVERAAGRRQEIRLRAVASFDSVASWTDQRALAPARPAYLRYLAGTPMGNREHNFWYEYDKSSRLLYVSYAAVADERTETVARFFTRVFAFADTVPVDKFVLDLRANGGGNNGLNGPIVEGLVKRDSTLARNGHFFVVIGRSTFSAAQNLATQLEARTAAIFVGEPSGGSPNGFGDPARLVLPNSGIEMRLSTVWWQDADPRDPRLTIGPQVAADLTIADERAGRDPALEAIKSYTPTLSAAEAVQAGINRAGRAGGSAALQAWRAAPRNRYQWVENELNLLGVQYFSRNNIPGAIAAFEVYAEAYPESWKAHESLARAYAAADRKADALKEIERTLLLNSKAAIARDLRDRLSQ